MFPSKSNPEHLAQTNPSKLINQVRKGGIQGAFGGPVSPVPPGVKIVDSDDTRDGQRPVPAPGPIVDNENTRDC